MSETVLVLRSQAGAARLVRKLLREGSIVHIACRGTVHACLIAGVSNATALIKFKRDEVVDVTIVIA